MANDPKVPIRRFVEEVQDQGRVEVIDEIFSEKFYNHFPNPTGVSTGRDGVHTLSHAMRKAVPDLRVKLDATYVDGATVITQKTFSGTYSGEWFGVAGDGRAVRFGVIDIMKMDDDNKIVEHWAGMMDQLFAPAKDG
jgi:predicted ester cyclase